MKKKSLMTRIYLGALLTAIILPNSSLGFFNSQNYKSSPVSKNYDDVYEEVTYEDLVQELSVKKKTSANNASRFNSNGDQMLMHAGIGIVNSQNTLEFNGEQNFRAWNGVQISMGIDTSNPNWATLFTMRTYSPARSGSETRSAQELGAGMVFHNKFTSGFGARAGGGLSVRQIRISDDINNINVRDTTPMALISAGVDLYLAPTASIGIEAGARNAFMADTADKSSSDLTIRLDAYF